MKNHQERKGLTLGELVAGVYDSFDEDKAKGILQLAFKAQLATGRSPAKEPNEARAARQTVLPPRPAANRPMAIVRASLYTMDPARWIVRPPRD
jgi:hypothetical protein